MSSQRVWAQLSSFGFRRTLHAVAG